MKQPCVAVDVSKSKSHYQGWINIDKKCGNAKCIEHSKIGFKEISEKLKELEGITKILILKMSHLGQFNIFITQDRKNIFKIIF